MDEGSKQEILSRIAQTTGALTKLKTIIMERQEHCTQFQNQTNWCVDEAQDHMERQEHCTQFQNQTDAFLVISIFLYVCETSSYLRPTKCLSCF